MNIPISPRTRGPALPQIYVQDSNPSDRFRTSGGATSYNSTSSPANIPGPMAIRNRREPVPPPLPPPRYVPDIPDNEKNEPDHAWHWRNPREDDNWERSAPDVASGSSLYGGFSNDASAKDDGRRTGYSINNPEPIDEGYQSLLAMSIGLNRSGFDKPSSSVRSRFQSSVHDTYQSNAQAFDKSQLQKLDARRGSDNTTPPRGYSRSTFSSSVNDASPTSRMTTMDHQYGVQLKPLSLPILPGKPSFVESPLSRWAEPLSSAVSPGNPFSRYSSGQVDFRSPNEISDSDRSPLPYTRRSGSGSVASICDDASSVTSRRDVYDARASPDHDVHFHMEETSLRRLKIEDYSRQDGLLSGVATGQKRRASSPPVDDTPALNNVGNASDLFRRRESGSRSSPGPRYHSASGSFSSTASGPRSASYTSTALSINASSMTSMNSFSKLSPNGLSPAPTDGSESPYPTSFSQNTSPRGSISRSNHGRNTSDSRPLVTPRKLSDASHSNKNSTPQMQGVFICECCPKKPKKFESQEDLNAHEQEKQYECAYCRNRFKNKNEAERHQNSLHLRRHSWSCAALSDYAAAFHTSPTRPNDADSCGYCGEDFPRSGVSSPGVNGHQTATATEQDWGARIIHLQEMHKFRECNHAKKFFRADHFRQHLKHSHAGTSGKWTNMLENACMKDEPLPEPIRGHGRGSPSDSRVSRINEEEEMS
ncbi:hypothetical protein B0O99DRAFT_648039 [Bisporella sp. PMI_857]|nr:hypothetical protein B0O99DRAFT_648039 [Bisporella sp. PMI_857]